MNPNRLLGAWLAPLVCLACNVESTTRNTGGVEEEETSGTCPRGVAVVLSDYVSTQIALSNLEGETLSESFLSTGSTKTDGLSFALSGDVALPSSRPASGNVVLLDRFGTNVISWADPSTAEVIAQLAVGTGFESNPTDYLEVSETRAFVTRWGENGDPGQEPFDRGGDVLIVDTESYSIVGAIDLPRTADGDSDPLPPRPQGMTRVEDTVLVPLERLSADFQFMGEAVLVGVSIEDETVAFELPLTGLKACGRPALSPDGKTLAVACTGALTAKGDVEDLAQSALVLFDATTSPPTERRRFAASDIAGGPLQNDVVFATNERVLLKTQTSFGGAENNRWLAMDLESGDAEVLLEAQPDEDGKGKGLTYMGMSCAPGCSDVCLLADSDRGVLQRVRVDEDGAVTLEEPVRVEDRVGLPPRDVAVR